MADSKNKAKKTDDPDVVEYDTPNYRSDQMIRGFNKIRDSLRGEPQAKEDDTAVSPHIAQYKKIKIRPSYSVKDEETGQVRQVSGDEGPELRAKKKALTHLRARASSPNRI